MLRGPIVPLRTIQLTNGRNVRTWACVTDQQVCTKTRLTTSLNWHTQDNAAAETASMGVRAIGWCVQTTVPDMACAMT